VLFTSTHFMHMHVCPAKVAQCQFYLINDFMGRVKQALNAGFRHLVFEDNYDTGTGDHYSLRQICDQSYIRGACSSPSALIISVVAFFAFCWKSILQTLFFCYLELQKFSSWEVKCHKTKSSVLCQNN
jgi:hypothetical protein